MLVRKRFAQQNLRDKALHSIIKRALKVVLVLQRFSYFSVINLNEMI